VPNEKTSCSGQCCERFPLSIAPTGRDTIEALRNKGHWGRPTWEESEFIANMLIPFQGPIRSEQSLADIPWAQRSPSEHHLPEFTCKHLGPTGCTVYDHRPNICRRHGVTASCDHQRDKTCTLDPEPWLIPPDTLTRPRKGDEQGTLVPQIEMGEPMLKWESTTGVEIDVGD